jgi:hypothetical protein
VLPGLQTLREPMEIGRIRQILECKLATSGIKH